MLSIGGYKIAQNDLICSGKRQDIVSAFPAHKSRSTEATPCYQRTSSIDLSFFGSQGLRDV